MGDFLTHSKTTVLSGNGLSDLVPGMLSYQMRVIRRYPEKGLPAPGLPFAVDVEVKTVRDYGICVNATVVAREVTSTGEGEILAKANVRTSTFSGCRGSTKLVFDPAFRPTKDRLVQLEIYDGSPGVGQLTPSRAGSISSPIHFGFSEKEGQDAGIYDKPTPGLLQPIENPFGDIGKSLNKVLWVAGLGLGAYLMTPFFPVLKVGGQKIASRLKK
ncbi:MAG: hypothetical protein WD625_08140 [Balneolales bacterium]